MISAAGRSSAGARRWTLQNQGRPAHSGNLRNIRGQELDRGTLALLTAAVPSRERLLKPYFAVQVMQKSHEARQRLLRLGIFRKVEVVIDTSQGEDALPNGLDVTFEVTELRRLTGSYNTMVGNNEGSMVSGTLPHSPQTSAAPETPETFSLLSDARLEAAERVRPGRESSVPVFVRHQRDVVRSVVLQTSAGKL